MCLDYLHTFRRLIFFTIFFGTWWYTEIILLFSITYWWTSYIFLVIKKDEYLTFEKGIFFFIQIAIKNLR